MELILVFNSVPVNIKNRGSAVQLYKSENQNGSHFQKNNGPHRWKNRISPLAG